MAEGKRKFGCLQLAVVGLLLGSLVVCCGGGAMFLLGPQWLVGMVMEDAPLSFPAPHRDADVAARLEADLTDDGIVRMTGPDATAWVWSHDPDHLTGCQIDIDEHVRLRLSMQLDETKEEYVNLSIGGTFELEHGWFTHAAIDEFTIGDIALGPYMEDQELASDFNRSLADNRSQDDEFDARMNAVESMGIDGDAIVVAIDLDAWPDPLPEEAPAPEPVEDADGTEQDGAE